MQIKASKARVHNPQIHAQFLGGSFRGMSFSRPSWAFYFEKVNFVKPITYKQSLLLCQWGGILDRASYLDTPTSGQNFEELGQGPLGPDIPADVKVH